MHIFTSSGGKILITKLIGTSRPLGQIAVFVSPRPCMHYVPAAWRVDLFEASWASCFCCSVIWDSTCTCTTVVNFSKLFFVTSWVNFRNVWACCTVYMMYCDHSCWVKTFIKTCPDFGIDLQTFGLAPFIIFLDNSRYSRRHLAIRSACVCDPENVNAESGCPACVVFPWQAYQGTWNIFNLRRASHAKLVVV